MDLYEAQNIVFKNPQKKKKMLKKHISCRPRAPTPTIFWRMETGNRLHESWTTYDRTARIDGITTPEIQRKLL